MKSKGKHLIVDIKNVPRHICLNDKIMLRALSESAEMAGANVISTTRYKFGEDSPPGFAVLIMLDESHCSAHSYADDGLIAMDIFTCGDTDPERVFDNIVNLFKFEDFEKTIIDRFKLR